MGENLKEALISTLSHWELDPEKQVCITMDSGSNIKLACQLCVSIALGIILI